MNRISTNLFRIVMSTFYNSKSISPKAFEAINQKITSIEIREFVPILSPGQCQEYLYFIKRGVVRCYYKAFEDEWTNWFAAEGSPIFSAQSFLNNSPSPEYIETCTPVSLYCLSKRDCQKLLKDFPELHELAFSLLQSYLLHAEKRMYGLHMLTACQRYEQFLENNLHLSNRLKMQHIASYLGITPTHFSRVRKEYAIKNRLELVVN